MTVVYRLDTATRDEVYWHLKSCDSCYSPWLSLRVDLRAYASKIADNATSFEAWDGPLLVGMVNAYLNDLAGRVAYITNVSVLKSHGGRGIASVLLEMCLQRAKLEGFRSAKLEVSPTNHPALRLYAKAGFRVAEQNGEHLLMVCEITDTADKELP